MKLEELSHEFTCEEEMKKTERSRYPSYIRLSDSTPSHLCPCIPVFWCNGRAVDSAVPYSSWKSSSALTECENLARLTESQTGFTTTWHVQWAYPTHHFMFHCSLLFNTKPLCLVTDYGNSQNFPLFRSAKEETWKSAHVVSLSLENTLCQ